MILLERGVHELLGKIENKQLGRLTHRHRKKRAPALTQTIAVATWKGRIREPERRGTWLGLCGPEQVTWTVDGVRIPNEVIAQQTLMEAAAEGIAPPIENGCEMPRVVATGDGDGIDLEAYVRGHLSHCGRLPHGATCLGTDKVHQRCGQGEADSWLLRDPGRERGLAAVPNLDGVGRPSGIANPSAHKEVRQLEKDSVS